MGNLAKQYFIRADFDVPIEEDTGLSFASKNKGVMHVVTMLIQHTCYTCRNINKLKNDLMAK